MKEEHHTYDIYYDEEGDFLEITFGIPPKKEYSEEIEQGVFITKDEDTEEIKSISIISFKKRTHILKELLQKLKLKLPLEITV